MKILECGEYFYHDNFRQQASAVTEKGVRLQIAGLQSLECYANSNLQKLNRRRCLDWHKLASQRKGIESTFPVISRRVGYCNYLLR